MTSPLAKTFRLLATSSSPEAGATLLHALRRNDPETMPAVVSALIERGVPRELNELLARFADLPEAAQSIVLTNLHHLSPILRRILQQPDAPTLVRQQAIELIRQADSSEQLPALLAALPQAAPVEAERLAVAIFELADRLYGQLKLGWKQAGWNPPADAQRLRETVVESLVESWENASAPTLCEEIVEAALILGTPDDAALMSCLSSTRSPAAAAALRVLHSSRHPGVFELIIELFARPVPHPVARQVMEERVDPQFICHVLRALLGRRRNTLLRNLSILVRAAWIENCSLVLPTVPGSLHAEVIRFVAAARIPRDQRVKIVDWFGEHAGENMHAAARQALLDPPSASYQSAPLPVELPPALLRGADENTAPQGHQPPDEMPPPAVDLQAAIRRLDSSLREVREAARRQLAGFELQRMLNLFEDYTPALCRQAGEIIRKVDRRWLETLLREVANPLPTRRIRAIRAAEKLGLHVRIVPALAALAEDPEADVRRAAVDVLASIPTQAALEALQPLLKDVSPRVRTAAAAASRRILQSMRRESNNGNRPHAA